MNTPILDDDFTGLRKNCDRDKCPSIDDFERYATGLLASINEDVFNEIEDCLFLRKCPFALLYQTAIAMIITDEKVTVTLEMLQQNDMTRGANEVGIPTLDGGLEWKSFDDLTESDYDAIENYFIETKGER